MARPKPRNCSFGGSKLWPQTNFRRLRASTLNSVDLGNPVSLTSVAFDDFAKVTGGKVYSNDFEKAVSETVGASHSSDIIQYDAPRSDGKPHKIRVTSTRKGVHLQVKLTILKRRSPFKMLTISVRLDMISSSEYIR